MKKFKLTEEVVTKIKDYRHEVRSLGTKGGCYQVALFIEHYYGLPMKEGVYQSSKLEPIVSHRWNLLSDGSILESTGDQFCEGTDVSIVSKFDNLFQRYRPQWSDSLNPSITPWLESIEWLGVTDQEWRESNPDKKISKGFWLDDNSSYMEWRMEMIKKYEVYRS